MIKDKFSILFKQSTKTEEDINKIVEALNKCLDNLIICYDYNLSNNLNNIIKKEIRNENSSYKEFLYDLFNSIEI